MSQAQQSTATLSDGSPSSLSPTKSRDTQSSPTNDEYSLSLAALRNQQVSLILSGQKINATLATPDELTTFFADVVNVINQRAKPWSVFIRWHALNAGLNAGTLRLFSPIDNPNEIHIYKVSEEKSSVLASSAQSAEEKASVLESGA